MRIGKLADRTGVSVRSLRYYEEKGMLASDRTPRGQRVYSEKAVDRVIRIQELFAAGLSSGTIEQILPCMRDVDGGPSLTATPLLVAELQGQRRRINERIRDLERARGVLDEVISAASGR